MEIRVSAPEAPSGPHEEIFRHAWMRPILQILSAEPTRYRDVVIALVRLRDDPQDAPNENQVSSALSRLSELGLAEKLTTGLRAPWAITELGKAMLADINYFVDLLSADAIVDVGAFTRNNEEDADVALSIRTDLASKVGSYDPNRAHPARRYDYWLGGKDNFAADRRSGDELAEAFPRIRDGVRANRDLLGRIVRVLAAEYGIRQFLDIGTGLPTVNNTHEVAQAAAPDSRVVYVDNDPLVLSHARALLTPAPGGATAYIEADVRDPDAILASRELRETLDLTQPVALLLIAVLHFVPGQGAAQPLVDRLMLVLPPGSILAVTHATEDFMSRDQVALHASMRRDGRSDFWARGKAELASLFRGLELLEPGIVAPTKWRPDPDTPDFEPDVVHQWVGVARKN
jgi:trans-aconitate methyltransferase